MKRGERTGDRRGGQGGQAGTGGCVAGVAAKVGGIFTQNKPESTVNRSRKHTTTVHAALHDPDQMRHMNNKAENIVNKTVQ